MWSQYSPDHTWSGRAGPASVDVETKLQQELHRDDLVVPPNSLSKSDWSACCASNTLLILLACTATFLHILIAIRSASRCPALARRVRTAAVARAASCCCRVPRAIAPQVLRTRLSTGRRQPSRTRRSACSARPPRAAARAAWSSWILPSAAARAVVAFCSCCCTAPFSSSAARCQTCFSFASTSRKFFRTSSASRRAECTSRSATDCRYPCASRASRSRADSTVTQTPASSASARSSLNIRLVSCNSAVACLARSASLAACSRCSWISCASIRTHSCSASRSAWRSLRFALLAAAFSSILAISFLASASSASSCATRVIASASSKSLFGVCDSKIFRIPSAIPNNVESPAGLVASRSTKCSASRCLGVTAKKSRIFLLARQGSSWISRARNCSSPSLRCSVCLECPPVSDLTQRSTPPFSGSGVSGDTRACSAAKSRYLCSLTTSTPENRSSNFTSYTVGPAGFFTRTDTRCCCPGVSGLAVCSDMPNRGDPGWGPT
mmetsp:Transcript_3005/g.7167  ORF Transcript_3005/g.7167 Transcript_3005/m.7167 type:complete len:498 (-) Transcript_3005:43-1536(-)